MKHIIYNSLAGAFVGLMSLGVFSWLTGIVVPSSAVVVICFAFSMAFNYWE